MDYRVVIEARRDALPEPPPGDGPFGLSEPGILEGLIEAAGMRVMTAGEVDCPFVYPDTERFWKAILGEVSHAFCIDPDRIMKTLRPSAEERSRP